MDSNVNKILQNIVNTATLAATRQRPRCTAPERPLPENMMK